MSMEVFEGSKNTMESTNNSVIESDKRELLSTLDTLRSGCESLIERMSPLLEDNIPVDLSKTEDGMSYLQMRMHLMLAYNRHLLQYTLLKANGTPIKGHPLIHKLSREKNLLLKLRVLDARLKYQIDKSLKMGILAPDLPKSDIFGMNDVEERNRESEGEGHLKYKPNPSLLLMKLTTGGDREDGDNVNNINNIDNINAEEIYRPSLVNPVYIQGENKQRRELRNKKKIMLKSAVIQEVKHSLSSEPSYLNMHPLGNKHQSNYMNEEEEEEIRYKRISMSKKDKKEKKRKEERINKKTESGNDLMMIDDILKEDKMFKDLEGEREERRAKMERSIREYRGSGGHKRRYKEGGDVDRMDARNKQNQNKNQNNQNKNKRRKYI